jgi:hypothetical protein
MRTSLRLILAGATLLASAVPVMAGGLYVLLGNPEANPKARDMGAVVTLKLAGCHEPEKAQVNAVAIGNLNGERKSIPLQLTKLDEAGSYAVTRQWPAEGRWVLQFIAHDGDRIASTLVTADTGGVERHSAKMAMKMPSDGEVAAMLNGKSKL